jgi:hypothetical protein
VIFKGALSNMKNKLNGTRGFLNQISKKIQIDRGFDKLIRDKEFSNKELKNLICSLRKDSFVENKIDLMLNSYIDSISTDEIKTVKETLNKDFTDYNYFHLSSRCIIKKKLFHSLFYKRKGKIDSYSVCFCYGENERFGKIEKFISIDSKIYAFIHMFPVYNNKCDFPKFDFSNHQNIDKKEIDVNALFDLFSKFYFRFNENEHYLKLIPIDNIICHCLIVHSKFNFYFTKLAYCFEHD